MKRQILLVEDDKSLSRAVSLKLKKEGYAVCSAGTIGEAWEVYRETPVFLIICDVGLPDGSGLDFCEKVRRNEQQRGQKERVIFLFLTAMDAETDMINGYEAGGDDYITKPFSLAVLVSKVNAVMARYGAEDAGHAPGAMGGNVPGGMVRSASGGMGGNVSGGLPGSVSGAMGGNVPGGMISSASGGLPGSLSGGGKAAGKSCICSGNIKLYTDENRAAKDGEYLRLTANEHKLLVYFMENPMRILSRAQLLEAVWDVDGNFVDENTLAVNIRRLREKIEKDPSRPEIIKNVRGLGYIWERECDRR